MTPMKVLIKSDKIFLALRSSTSCICVNVTFGKYLMLISEQNFMELGTLLSGITFLKGKFNFLGNKICS